MGNGRGFYNILARKGYKSLNYKKKGLFFCRIQRNLQRRRVFTSDIASGIIQCAHAVNNSSSGLLVTPHAKAINIIYEFCYARQRHDV